MAATGSGLVANDTAALAAAFAISVPVDTPADVTYLPASTQRGMRCHSAFVPKPATQSKALWLVVAGLPSSNPAFASTAAPVQTDAVSGTILSIVRTQRIAPASFSTFSVPYPPGIVQTSKRAFTASSRVTVGATRGPL
jgi:hypothetical protein